MLQGIDKSLKLVKGTTPHSSWQMLRTTILSFLTCGSTALLSAPAFCTDRAQAYVGAFLRRPDARREANAASLEGDLHLDEHGQIVRPVVHAEDGAKDPADALHDVGTFAQVCAGASALQSEP